MPFQKGNQLGHNTLGHCKPGLEAREHPSSLDIVWAAGLFEGEGSCGISIKQCSFTTISQKEAWILQRLQLLFGGTLKHIQNSGFKKGLIYKWTISGSRSRGFLMTIYKFLSPHRQLQTRKSLNLCK